MYSHGQGDALAGDGAGAAEIRRTDQVRRRHPHQVDLSVWAAFDEPSASQDDVAGGREIHDQPHELFAEGVVAVTYQVLARRWPLGWELHIEGIGVTQSRTLATAEKAVRSFLAMDDIADADTAEVVITPELDGNLASEAEAAREATRRAERARDDAAAQTRKVAHDLKAAGMSGADVAVVLGVSPQRVSQLMKS